MQTVLHIKPQELNNHFLQVVKTLFKNAAELEIIVSETVPSDIVFSHESREEYWMRIDKAIEDVNNGRGISMSMNDLEKYAAKRAKR